MANGNERFISNADQPQCRKCGSYVSKGEPVNGMYTYECAFCGLVVETEKKRVAAIQ